MAHNEADKIEELKRRVEEDTLKVAQKREDEEDKRQQIAVIEGEITALEKKASEAHELEEEIELKNLRKVYEELEKTLEEQRQKIEAQKVR